MKLKDKIIDILFFMWINIGWLWSGFYIMEHSVRCYTFNLSSIMIISILVGIVDNAFIHEFIGWFKNGNKKTNERKGKEITEKDAKES